jgi:hypothetical protein
LSALALLEIGKIIGLIVGAWFALVGWKLVPLTRLPRHPWAARPASGK